MKKFVFLLLLALGLPLWAQETVPASAVFPLLGYPRDAAAAGMAGAGSASPSQLAFAAFGNPAAVVFSPQKGALGASYGLWNPAGASHFNGGLSLRMGPGFAVMGGVAYQMSPMQDYGYAPSDLVGALGVALKFGEHVGLGAAVRYVRQQLLEDYELSGFAFTGMLQFHAAAWDVAAGVANVGGQVEGASLPSSARLVAAWAPVFGDHGLRLALDGDYYFLGSLGVSAGAEYAFKDLAFARLGYRYATAGAPIPSHLAVGLGLKVFGFSLDLTYLAANSYIGSSLMAGLGYRF